MVILGTMLKVLGVIPPLFKEGGLKLFENISKVDREKFQKLGGG